MKNRVIVIACHLIYVVFPADRAHRPARTLSGLGLRATLRVRPKSVSAFPQAKLSGAA